MIPYNTNIALYFPNTTIDLIISLPTYKTLNSIHLKINQNTTSVNSNLGDGIIGLLPLTISADVYNNLPDTPFVIPNNTVPHVWAPETPPKYQLACEFTLRTREC